MVRMVASLVLVLSLVGCAPATVQGVRDDASGRAEIDVELNYQEVYRRIITPARACFQGSGLLGPQFIVQGDVFTDVPKAEIAFVIAGTFSSTHPAVIDIAGFGPSRTRIVSHYWSRGWAEIGSLVERWVREGYTGCGPLA